MPRLTAESLTDILETAGLDVDRYSGRGMYGDECPSFTTEDPIAAIAQLVADLDDARERQDLAEAFKGACSDSMGHDAVVYFPSLTFPKGAEAAAE